MPKSRGRKRTSRKVPTRRFPLAAAARLQADPDLLATMPEDEWRSFMADLKEATGYPGEIRDHTAEIEAWHRAGHPGY